PNLSASTPLSTSTFLATSTSSRDPHDRLGRNQEEEEPAGIARRALIKTPGLEIDELGAGLAGGTPPRLLDAGGILGPADRRPAVPVEPFLGNPGEPLQFEVGHGIGMIRAVERNRRGEVRVADH